MKKKFLLNSDVAKVQNTSRGVLAFLEPLNLTTEVRFDIRLCLEEALINAIKHGGANLTGAEVDVEATGGAIRITVDDHGRGFDIKTIEDCTKEKNLFKDSGRGVYLIRRLMDGISYNEKGNKLTMIKLLKKTRSAKQRTAVHIKEK